jgi:hypothetical protein
LLFDRQDREKTLDKNKKIHTQQQGANLGHKQGIRRKPFEIMTRRKPWEKTRNRPLKIKTRRKPWAKTRNHPKTNGEQRLVCRKAYELLPKDYCTNSDNRGNSDRAGGALGNLGK